MHTPGFGSRVEIPNKLPAGGVTPLRYELDVYDYLESQKALRQEIDKTSGSPLVGRMLDAVISALNWLAPNTSAQRKLTD